MIQFIMARKRRLLQAPTPWKTATKLAVGLGIIFGLHIWAMIALEKMSFFDALWLTATTAVTVGYGDMSASTIPGRMATMILLYGCGIYLLADAASRLIAYQSSKTERKLNGTWRWKMKDHVVIIGSPKAHPEHFFGRLVKELDAALGNPEIILLTSSFTDPLPDCITQHNAVHYKGSGHLSAELNAVDILHARSVILLSDDPHDVASDSKVLDIASRITDMGFKGSIVAELVNDENRERSKVCAANIRTIRPARGYPEMLVRALAAPGSEEILENYFREAGDEISKVDLIMPITATWREIVMSVMDNDCGMAVGYQDANSFEVISNPSASKEVVASALYIVIGDDHADANMVLNHITYGQPDLPDDEMEHAA